MPCRACLLLLLQAAQLLLLLVITKRRGEGGLEDTDAHADADVDVDVDAARQPASRGRTSRLTVGLTDPRGPHAGRVHVSVGGWERSAVARVWSAAKGRGSV